MSKPVTLYDVWTDGSYNNTHHVGGAGWLIRRGEETKEGFKPLADFPKDAKPHGSDAAEIFAVSCALRAIPAGSTVKLRLDPQNVIDWLKAGEITTKSKREVRFLRSIFSGAMEGIQAMESVEFIKVGGRQNEELKHVNDLARKASHMARPRK